MSEYGFTPDMRLNWLKFSPFPLICGFLMVSRHSMHVRTYYICDICKVNNGDLTFRKSNDFYISELD